VLRNVQNQQALEVTGGVVDRPSLMSSAHRCCCSPINRGSTLLSGEIPRLVWSVGLGVVWYLSPALAQLGSVALPPRSPAAENDPLALDVLATIPVENEHGVGYDRDLFFEGLDEDGDGCRTRSEVLIRDSLVSPTISGVCRVKAGRWLSVYDGVTVTDPTALEVDHVVALEEAWDSGAWQWHDMRRASFANDLLDSRTLRPVTSATNQAKGNADPSNWIPPNESYVCTFLSDWIAIKARWGLTMDQSEAGRLRNLLTERCADQTVAPWPAAEPWPPSVSSTARSGPGATG